jgi:beta-lactamase regulating signal transducer with metallopeptidase domain
MWPNDVLSDPLWQRLAIALLHFLWQGALVAALYAVAIQWLGRRPEQRYVIGVVALVVLAACPTITYWFVQPPHPAPVSSVTDAAPSASVVSVAATNKLPVLDLAWMDDARIAGMSKDLAASSSGVTQQDPKESEPISPAWRQELNRWVLTAWLLGVLVFAVRLFAGTLGLRLLSASATIADGEHLRLVERLSRAMRLGRIPRLMVSDRVRQAIATGFFRPLIILPAAWLSELPPSVIEAIVAHELAHIRRHDLWINLVQRVVEALLFFHPAVWWISRQLRSDREMCCDELAVAATRQKLEYVSALELVARRAAREPVFSLATGIGGRKMQLLERVRHVLGLPSATRPRAWWPAGILALAVPCGLWLMSDAAMPLVHAQDREESAERERDERENRERAEERERDAREDADRERDRPREKRDEANRERDRERDRPEREVRDRDIRDREGDRPARDPGPRERREGDHGDRAPRERERPDIIRRDRERQANLELNFRRAQERAMQARRAEEAVMHQQRQVHEALEAARRQVQEALAQNRKQLAAEIQRAQESGQQERLQALHQQLEQLQRQAKEQSHAIDQKFEAFAREMQRNNEPNHRREEMQVRQMMQKVEHDLDLRAKELAVRAAEAEKAGDKALLEKIHAEAAVFKAEAAAQRDKLKRALGEQLGDKVTAKIAKNPLANKIEFKYNPKQPEGSPEAQQELMRMIKELRGEVQELRREVRELRQQSGRVEKNPGDKQAISFELDEVIEEKRVKPEVRLEFRRKSDEIEFVPRSEEEESVEPRIELEFSNEEIETIELDAVDKAAEAQAIELEIDIKNEELDKVNAVELEFTNDKLDKLNQELDEVKKLKLDSTIELNTEIKDKNDKPNKNAVEKTLTTTIEMIKGLSPVKAEIKKIETKNDIPLPNKLTVDKAVPRKPERAEEKRDAEKPADKPKS